MSSKAKQGKKLSVPREMAEIEKEYSVLCGKAGQLQYQIKIHTLELERLNDRIRDINNEAAARKQVDDQKGAAVENLGG